MVGYIPTIMINGEIFQEVLLLSLFLPLSPSSAYNVSNESSDRLIINTLTADIEQLKR